MDLPYSPLKGTARDLFFGLCAKTPLNTLAPDTRVADY